MPETVCEVSRNIGSCGVEKSSVPPYVVPTHSAYAVTPVPSFHPKVTTGVDNCISTSGDVITARSGWETSTAIVTSS